MKPLNQNTKRTKYFQTELKRSSDTEYRDTLLLPQKR